MPRRAAACRAHGLPLRLSLTQANTPARPSARRAVGVDEDGTPFRWIARRSRKRVLQPYEAPSPPPAVVWRASLSWKHHSKPGWWVAVLFVAGSLLFLITGIARETRAVGDPEVWPPGLGSLAAGLTAWPEAMACWLLYFPAVLIQARGARRARGACSWQDHLAF